MRKEFFEGIRQASIRMGVLCAIFVAMYSVIVLASLILYAEFGGFLPDAKRSAIRAVFYSLSAAAAGLWAYLRKRRFSQKALQEAHDGPSFIKNVMLTVILSMSLSVVPMLAGFFNVLPCGHVRGFLRACPSLSFTYHPQRPLKKAYRGAPRQPLLAAQPGSSPVFIDKTSLFRSKTKTKNIL